MHNATQGAERTLTDREKESSPHLLHPQRTFARVGDDLILAHAPNYGGFGSGRCLTPFPPEGVPAVREIVAARSYCLFEAAVYHDDAVVADEG